MLAVTTYPEWGWDVYAKRCISTWLKSWPGSVLIYYEGEAPPSLEGAEFRPLSECRGWLEFQKARVPHPIRPSYLFDVKRFSHKVYAQLDATERTDQFWWIDADVEMKSPIGDEMVQEITNKSFVSFLGRSSYTETGILAFNAMDENFDDFAVTYRECYDDGKIFNLPYWTDCHAFDYARRGGGFNLTPMGRGVENVLRTCCLGKYFEHHKGNRKMQLEEQ